MSYFGIRVAGGGGSGGVSTADVDARIRTVSPTLSEEVQAPDAVQNVEPTVAHTASKKVTKVLTDGTTEYWKSDGATWTKTATAQGGSGGGVDVFETLAEAPVSATKDSMVFIKRSLTADHPEYGFWRKISNVDGEWAKEQGFAGDLDDKTVTPISAINEMTKLGWYMIGDRLLFKFSTDQNVAPWEPDVPK